MRCTRAEIVAGPVRWRRGLAVWKVAASLAAAGDRPGQDWRVHRQNV